MAANQNNLNRVYEQKNELISPAKINECFVYLGKEYSIDMKPDKIKETLGTVH